MSALVWAVIVAIPLAVVALALAVRHHSRSTAALEVTHEWGEVGQVQGPSGRSKVRDAIAWRDPAAPTPPAEFDPFATPRPGADD